MLKTLLIILCPAIAKTIVGSWLQDGSLSKAVGEEIVDALKDFVLDRTDRDKTQQSIEQIAQQIAAQMRPIFDLEAASLDDNTRTAIQLAVVDTLRKSQVTSDLLIQCRLKPEVLNKYLLDVDPNACSLFSHNETAIYQRLLVEVSRGIITVAPSLEGFTLSFSTETLNQLDRIANELTENFAREQQTAAEFERKYRAAVVRQLDRLEMFGLPRMDEITSRQSLSRVC